MSLAPWRCPHASRPGDVRMPRVLAMASKTLLVKKQNDGGGRRRPKGSSRFSEEVSPPLLLLKPPFQFPTAKASSLKFRNSLCYALRLSTHAHFAYALSFANLFSKFTSKAQNENNK
ncbi:hypothetical protein VNO80_19235 [Phaseolus coccineus]|uniref:Uncharacterized protein n=1 Tax=Phaseolus coccineus TaxID=3886 RepID=A0AAN9MLU9_PHACN